MQNTLDQLQIFGEPTLNDLTSSHSVHLAKISALPEPVKEWTESEALSYLTQSGSLLRPDQTYLSGKMLKGLSAATLAKIFGQLSKPLPTLGVIDSNGNCLIRHGLYPKIESEFTLSELLQAPEEVESTYFLSEKIASRLLTLPNKNRANTITARYYGAQANGAYIIERKQQNMIKQTARGNNKGGLHQIAPTITSNSYEHNNHVIGDYRSDEGFRPLKDGNCPTLAARARTDGSGQPLLNRDKSIRRLTEIECERLQGFPDSWTQRGVFEDGEKKVSATQRYKMLGNSVSVPVVKAVGKRILEAM